MKKSIITLALALVLVLGFSAPAVASQNEIWVFIDGEKLTLSTAPISIGGRTLVPMRPIFESLGYTVEWEANTQQIKGTRGTDSIIMTVNSNRAIVNGKAVELDVAATIQNSRTFVPIRFVGEASGKKVEWDSSTRSVYIGAGANAGDAAAAPSSPKVKMYADYPTVPDFGAFSGATLYQRMVEDDSSVAYLYHKSFDSNFISLYDELLEANGFRYYDSFETSYSVQLIYNKGDVYVVIGLIQSYFSVMIVTK